MKVFCIGEILLRLSPPDGLRFVQAHSFEAVYGGSEANVAVSLAQMGASSAFVTRIPDNELGFAALNALSRYGVDTSASIVGGERLGLYFLEHGAGRRSSKILYDRQNSSMSTLASGMIDWQKTLKKATWLHWSGITPALSQAAADATWEAVQVAAAMGIPISCDLNYREKLWKYGKTPAQIMPKLIEMTNILFGDQSTFDLYFGIKGENEQSLLHNMAQRFPKLQYISMSSREGFSASHNTYRGLLFDRKNVFLSQLYDLPDMLDRIGGGDAFMAGLIFGLHQPQIDAQEAIEYAAAAGALKHYIRGDFNLSTAQEIRALMAGNTGGRVGR
jgi:2-dehydro-3-deoxygluconokinase